MGPHCVEFRDLEFDHAFVKAIDRHGHLYPYCWAPVGMPRITKSMERCVFFLHGLNPKPSVVPEALPTIGPGATGFFVRRDSNTLPGLAHHYAVSNAHAINHYSWIRLDREEGPPEFIQRDPSEWICSSRNPIFKTEADLAVTDVTDDLTNFARDAGWARPVSCINEKDFVTPDFLNREDIGIGDDTIMLGLFADHDGGDITQPVGRFGNLAAIPDARSPVVLWPGDNRICPSFLNDMRSRSGFSGSPVWVWRTPYTNMNAYGNMGHEQILNKTNAVLRLVGIHRGQFPDETKVKLEMDGREYKAQLPSSMTVVVPAWEISLLLNNSKLDELRRVRDERPDRVALAKQDQMGFRCLE